MIERNGGLAVSTAPASDVSGTFAASSRGGAVRVVGELLITGGVVVLLFAAYLLWGTTLRAAAAQEDLRTDLTQEWAARRAALPSPAPPLAASTEAVPAPATVPPAELVTGEGFAVIRLPTLGNEEEHVVVEGVTTDALRRGPGHMPGTAMPGEVGNVVLPGHRTTYGAPFRDLDDLRPGDLIQLETATAVHDYRVLGLQLRAQKVRV